MPQVSSPMRYVTVTPIVLNADAYDANDTLFDTLLVPDAADAIDAPAILDTVIWIDRDDNTAAALTFYFLNSNVLFGVKDAAPSISDANSVYCLGHIAMPAANILDYTDFKVGTVANAGLIIQPETGHRRIYVAATTAGTPTHTTGGVTLKLGFRSI